MNEMLKIKEEISQELKGKSPDEIISYYHKSGVEFDRLMTEFKLKWAKEKQNLQKSS